MSSSYRWLLLLIAVGLNASALVPQANAAQDDDTFALKTRSRTETKPGSGRFHPRVSSQEWKGAETAFIVCDMWDLHHCLNATKRGTEMAPRMNRVLTEARSRGAIVIHAPSSCVGFYKDHPARKRAQSMPRTKTPPGIAAWCHQIPSEEQGEYPIDQSDGGEDDDPKEHLEWAEKLKAKGLKPGSPWTRQTDLLTIEDKDYISDNGEEIWSILENQNVKNVVLVGVHTNMCVLGRPFGLRQMAKNGKNVVLMRDMTDTMYNPARRPFVSHFTGTDLIVEHIEKWVCPTITSDQLIGGTPFRFKNDRRKRLVMLVGEREYKTNESLATFAAKHLGHDYSVEFAHASEADRNDFPGAAEAIAEADVLLVSVRRRALPPAQMAALRKYVKSGKPIVGIRTANHAFSLRGKEPPAGLKLWENFDAEIIGGNYTNHHGEGPDVVVIVAKNSANHPILKGIDPKKLVGRGSLYVVSPLQKQSQTLLIGTREGKPAEPIAWIHQTPADGRVFYTSLGHVDDFKQPAVQKLLKNALAWASGK